MTRPTLLSSVKMQVYDYIVAFREINGNSPTRREIKEALNISSTSVVNYYLYSLVAFGMLKVEPGKARMIEPIGGQ